ncbi:MAG TPA: HAD-IA family hydrolase [Usitatibacter sp.]|jgi:putative hydrolase of the HAD superfamily|nr:HAD-IA family hydrolase [Usitatibacter sp.]
MEPVRGVIFDLFHTLTARESEWSELPSTCELLGIDRVDWDRVLLESSRWRLVGEVRDPREIVERLARHLIPGIEEERLAKVLEMRTRRFADILARIPATSTRTLDSLRRAGMKLALLSNADALEIGAYADSCLARRFDVEVFSCDVGCAKPEPEIYALCLERLGLAPHECIFVGDGGSDELRGAKAAGLRTVFMSGAIEELWPERVAARRALADHHIRSIPEVLGWLGVDASEELA